MFQCVSAVIMPKTKSHYTLEQRIFMYDSYVKTNSCREVRWRFIDRVPAVRAPHRETVRNLVNIFRQTGSVLNKKQRVNHRVLTEGKLDDIGQKLERSQRKSLRKLAQESGISKISAWNTTELLKSPLSQRTETHGFTETDLAGTLRANRVKEDIIGYRNAAQDQKNPPTAGHVSK